MTTNFNFFNLFCAHQLCISLCLTKTRFSKNISQTSDLSAFFKSTLLLVPVLVEYTTTQIYNQTCTLDKRQVKDILNEICLIFMLVSFDFDVLTVFNLFNGCQGATKIMVNCVFCCLASDCVEGLASSAPLVISSFFN